MATLNLPTSTRTAVWRLIVAQLQSDPTLSEVVQTWLTWNGDPQSTAHLAQVLSPALRLTPEMGPLSWFSAESQRGALVVHLEGHLPGLDVEDVLDLQESIERALYPRDGGAFQRQLVAAGAVTGLVVFDQPLVETLRRVGTAGDFEPMGTFRVDVLRQLL